jgi:hypothetical protein
MDMTLDEARELAELTDRIAANLKVIEQDGNTLDGLEELDKLSCSIVRNLEAINADNTNIEDLLEESNEVHRRRSE